MKVTQSEQATEQDVVYMTKDLQAMLNEFTESLKQAEEKAEQNKKNITDAINFDFDSMKSFKNKEHDKKWRKTKIIAGVAGVTGLVGMIAAGAITQNPTFFSPGNLVVGSLLPAIGLGAANYFAAFSPKHQNEMDKIEKARQEALDEAMNGEQVRHDQKEIEVNRAWFEAISNELFGDVTNEAIDRVMRERAAKHQESSQESSI